MYGTGEGTTEPPTYILRSKILGGWDTKGFMTKSLTLVVETEVGEIRLPPSNGGRETSHPPPLRVFRVRDHPCTLGQLWPYHDDRWFPFQ
eukprot:IDg23204t1